MPRWYPSRPSQGAALVAGFRSRSPNAVAAMVSFAMLTSPAAVDAHALRMTVADDQGTVRGQLFYSDETVAVKDRVDLLDAAGAELQHTFTDARGGFVFARVPTGQYRIVAEGEEGHRIEATLGVLAPQSAAGAAASVPGSDVAALRGEILALRQDLQRYEQRVRMGDVLGGVGLIFGVTGFVAWWRGRRVNDETVR
ncbi:MAG: carboxypeptidase regulatory-like domain-containing protein [Burkholderiales bacterium]|nr:carboxypeptidase regulatory-like domain-containing protein [Burkholderiales bacterium]